MGSTKDLSRREQEVADLLLEGKSNKQIAAVLDISEHTVEFHLTNLYAKLEVASRSEAIVKLGKSPWSSIVEEPGISTVDAEGKTSDNGADIPRQVSTGGSPMVDSKSYSANRPSRPYAIVISILALAVAALALAYALNGLLEKWASQICLACTHEANPAVPLNNVQSPTRLSSASKSGARPYITIEQGPSLPSPRFRHTVTRSQNGKALVIGGSETMDQFTANVAIFDPAAGSIAPAASLHAARHDHTATLLRDGRVLVVGGYNLPQQWLSDAEVYDLHTDTWTVVPPQYSHGTAHSATLMKDGRVLVVGGCIGDSVCTERVEIFDPKTNLWEDAASLPSDRASHTAQLLRDGRVLVVGGWGARGMAGGGDALVYDPSSDSWMATRPMIHLRSEAEAVRLSDGRVLVAGGMILGDGTVHVVTNSTEIYDPASNSWAPAAETLEPRYAFSLVALNNGSVMAAGGVTAWDRDWNSTSFLSSVEIYDPASDAWTLVGNLPRPGAFVASVALPGNRVWITGGQTSDSSWADTWLIRVAQ